MAHMTMLHVSWLTKEGCFHCNIAHLLQYEINVKLITDAIPTRRHHHHLKVQYSCHAAGALWYTR